MAGRSKTPYHLIGRRLARHQEELRSRGTNLWEDLHTNYVGKWISPTLAHVARVRTALVEGMTRYLVEQGLVNLERVQLSLVTDPLAHEVERLTEIPYRDGVYVATHSMIYAKILALWNPLLKGVFVDSPNLRLELPGERQRGRYLLDFSQLDVELRRPHQPDQEAYFHRTREVAEILREELQLALEFFSHMLRAGWQRVQATAEDSLHALGVVLEELPEKLPVFYLDDALQRWAKAEVEAALGEESPSQAFFVVGLLRENYDLVYPYLRPDGSRRPLATIPSRDIFNYDLVVRGCRRDGGRSPAVEVLSGGLREWIPQAIVARLVDQGIIPEPPVFVGGHLENLHRLGGYGPFLSLVCAARDGLLAPFPATFGAGIGIERLLWAILRGDQVRTIEDVTFFGKNPDSRHLFLF
ncbi:MAG: hypothetical protein NZ869_05995 [Thermoanaerobaculum sp.]|nr:hypothetical protein [Thermoanaerobaculum sp.]MDW7967470.1 hypothetical protein [Thermoanaerobaculum sp.]